jgi:ABC-type bacteriocin/lantibiotic exporter with double-glycine peptidase domain
MTILSGKQTFATILTIVGVLYAMVFRLASCQETEYREQTKRTHFQAESEKAAATAETAKATATVETAKATLERERLWDQQRKAKGDSK